MRIVIQIPRDTLAKNNTSAHKTAGFHARHSCAGQGDVNNCLDRGLKYNPFIWTLFSSLVHTFVRVHNQHTVLSPSVAEDRAESVTFLCLQLFPLAHAWFSVPCGPVGRSRRTMEAWRWSQATLDSTGRRLHECLKRSFI